MRAFRLCRATYPAYDGEGSRRIGGHWNSKGIRVLYLSENRSLAVLEILVHLSATIPDRYALGMADFPDDVAVPLIDESSLPKNWSTLDPRDQIKTRSIGDEWVEQQRSAILSVPSVIASERNYLVESRSSGVSAHRVCQSCSISPGHAARRAMGANELLNPRKLARAQTFVPDMMDL